MPPSLRDASDPQEWLRRARSNLIRAIEDRRLPGVVYEDLCFDAQQAAEKAIKAVLLHQGAPIPRIHGLGELLALVRKHGTEIPASITEAAALTEYAVTTRYPGTGEDISEAEYEKAVELARRTVDWAEGLIGKDRDGDVDGT
jgi:HEPN domain-containing protein